MSSVPLGVAVLGAGWGRRAGGPKLAATSGGKTWLFRILEVARAAGLEKAAVAVPPGWSEWAGREAPGARIVENADPDMTGMVGSLFLLVPTLRDCAGVVVWPVDHPWILPETVHRLVGAFRNEPESVWRPRWGGRGGHPIILPAALLSGLPGGDVPGGLCALIRNGGWPLRDLDVTDSGVRRNANGPGGAWISA